MSESTSDPIDAVTRKTNDSIAVHGDPDKMEDAVTEIYQKRENPVSSTH
jgi:hypothetical protein